MPFLYGYSPRYVRQSVDPQKDFLFGVEFEGNYSFPNLNGGKSYLRLLQADHAEYLKMAENQGHRLIRIGNGSGALFLVWKNLEPREGEFDFHQSDRIIRQTADAGNAILGVLGNLLMMKSYPEWLVKKSKLGDLKWRVGKSPAGYPPIQDFRRYVRTLAERYKREIRFWEVFNEPNLNMPGDAFVPYQKAAYEEIKKIDPGIQVVGPNVTGDLGGEMADFLDAFGRAGGFAYTDILSFHPYSSREEYSPYPADQAIRDIRKILKKYHAEHLPLWNTELYYIKQLHPHYAKQDEFESWRFLRRLLIDLGEGVKVVTLLPESRSLRSVPPFQLSICGTPRSAHIDAQFGLCGRMRFRQTLRRSGSAAPHPPAGRHYGLSLSGKGRQGAWSFLEISEKSKCGSAYSGKKLIAVL